MIAQFDSQSVTDQIMCQTNTCWIQNSIFCFKKRRNLEHMNSHVMQTSMSVKIQLRNNIKNYFVGESNTNKSNSNDLNVGARLIRLTRATTLRNPQLVKIAQKNATLVKMQVLECWCRIGLADQGNNIMNCCCRFENANHGNNFRIFQDSPTLW